MLDKLYPNMAVVSLQFWAIATITTAVIFMGGSIYFATHPIPVDSAQMNKVVNGTTGNRIKQTLCSIALGTIMIIFAIILFMFSKSTDPDFIQFRNVIGLPVYLLTCFLMIFGLTDDDNVLLTIVFGIFPFIFYAAFAYSFDMLNAIWALCICFIIGVFRLGYKEIKGGDH